MKRLHDFTLSMRGAVLLMLVIECLLAAVLWGALVDVDRVQIQPIGFAHADGTRAAAFRAGDYVTASHRMCIRRGVVVAGSPSVSDTETRARLMLTAGRYQLDAGCQPVSRVFRLDPGFPPGIYEYQTVLTYQTNWIGRDQHTASPPMKFTVMP